MYSKSLLIAIAALGLSAGCVHVPWSNQPSRSEVNLAFTIEKNLIVVSTVELGGRRGRFLFGSAQPRTVIDGKFARSIAAAGAVPLKLSEKESVRVTPLVADLRGVADAILGADAWSGHAVSVDFVSGLLTYQQEGIHPEGMSLFRFSGEPRIDVEVDGRKMAAVVDTTSPDTLTLPRGNGPARRAKVRLSVAGTAFGAIDAAFADVSAPRVGNRVLSKFLVTIDYGRGEVGLWRDPRTSL